MPRKMKTNSKCLVRIEIKVSLLSVADIVPAAVFLDHSIFPLLLIPINLENSSENQNQQFRERGCLLEFLHLKKESCFLQKHQQYLQYFLLNRVILHNGIISKMLIRPKLLAELCISSLKECIIPR